MNTKLYEFVMARLQGRQRSTPLKDIAEGAGIPYETLKKIAYGTTSNPGVQHVQKLADYFLAVDQAVVADPMQAMLQDQHTRAVARLADNPGDRLASVIVKNREDALADEGQVPLAAMNIDISEQERREPDVRREAIRRDGERREDVRRVGV